MMTVFKVSYRFIFAAAAITSSSAALGQTAEFGFGNNVSTNDCSDAALGDIGSPNGGPPDGNNDLIAVFPGAPGQLVVAYNVGIFNGEWQGFSEGDSLELSVGEVLTGVASGDLDGDGDTDVAVSSINSDAQDAAILLSNNNGSLTIAATLPLGSAAAPSALIIGDIDGANNLDLAITLEGLDLVQIALAGAAPFTFIPTNVPVPAGPVDIDTLARDKSVCTEVVSVSAQEEAITVLDYNMAAGTIEAQSFPLPPGSEPTAVEGRDFDGDGLEGIITANTRFGSIGFFKNVNESFTNYFELAAGDEPTHLAAADLDLDGDHDIAFIKNSDNPWDNKQFAVGVLNNQGGFVFGAGQDLTLEETEPAVLVSGDVDNNGLDNLVVVGAETSLPESLALSLPCPNFNDDDIVDIQDLNFILASIGTNSGDVNGDGATDSFDLNLVLQRFGQSCDGM